MERIYSDQKEYLEIEAEEARLMAFEEHGGDLFEVVRTNHVVGEWRWGNTYELVIKDIVVGNYWRTFYQTSSGDGEWDTFDDGFPLRFTLVRPVERIEIDYVDA